MTPAIAACRPVNTDGLPPDLPIPPAQVDDTLHPCTRCGQDCWVGPRKLALVQTGAAIIMCYLCAIATAGPGAAVVDLHPDRRPQPRT